MRRTLTNIPCDAIRGLVLAIFFLAFVSLLQAGPLPPTIAKAFNPTQIALNTNSTLSFTITNPNTNLQLTSVGFTAADTFPAGLVVATPNNLNNTCGGTATATAGSGSVNLTGVTLAASASCTFSVDVTGTTAGVLNNGVTVTASESGAGNTSIANLTVVAPPTISKSFGAASVLLNTSTSLSFTLSNPNITVSLTGVAFLDLLPAGLQVSSPNGLSGSCGGGTITAVAGSGSVSLTGATLAAGGSCTFSVNVTGITPGAHDNITGAVTSIEGGTGAISNTATLTVIGTDVSVGLTHSPDPAAIGGTLKFTATITNNGPQNANVTFNQTFTGAQYLVSANASLGSCSATEPVSCTLSGMGSGETRQVTVVVTPLLGRTLISNVRITPDIPDSNNSNNSASNTVRIRFKVIRPELAILRVRLEGTGSGIVISNPLFNCGPLCYATTEIESTIMLNAFPHPGSSFSGWLGACAGTGPCVVTMIGNKQVIAVFH